MQSYMNIMLTDNILHIFKRFQTYLEALIGAYGGFIDLIVKISHQNEVTSIEKGKIKSLFDCDLTFLVEGYVFEVLLDYVQECLTL